MDAAVLQSSTARKPTVRRGRYPEALTDGGEGRATSVSDRAGNHGEGGAVSSSGVPISSRSVCAGQA